MKVRRYREQQRDSEQERRRRLGHTLRAAIDSCEQCDDFGWVLNVEPLQRCEHAGIDPACLLVPDLVGK